MVPDAKIPTAERCRKIRQEGAHLYQRNGIFYAYTPSRPKGVSLHTRNPAVAAERLKALEHIGAGVRPDLRPGRRQIRRKPRWGGRIYFVQAGDDGPIKIGWTMDVERRLLELQNGNHLELRLLGSCEGSEQMEAQLHRRFAMHRMRREWFSPAVELTRHIALMASFGPETSKRKDSSTHLQKSADKSSGPAKGGAK